jgi:hypothetical protein
MSRSWFRSGTSQAKSDDEDEGDAMLIAIVEGRVKPRSRLDLAAAQSVVEVKQDSHRDKINMCSPRQYLCFDIFSSLLTLSRSPWAALQAGRDLLLRSTSLYRNRGEDGTMLAMSSAFTSHTEAVVHKSGNWPSGADCDSIATVWSEARFQDAWWSAVQAKGDELLTFQWNRKGTGKGEQCITSVLVPLTFEAHRTSSRASDALDWEGGTKV